MTANTKIIVYLCVVGCIHSGQQRQGNPGAVDLTPLISYETDVLVYLVSIAQLSSPESQRVIESTLVGQYRQNRAKGFTFQKMVVATSETEGFDVERVTTGPWPVGMWVERYRALAAARAPSTLLFALGDDAVLLQDMGFGDPKTLIVSGKDPRVMKVDGANAKVIHISLIPVPKDRLSFEKKRFFASAFVEVDRMPTKALAEEALNELGRKIPECRIQVVLRTDPWFIGFAEYPVGVRFVPFAPPVTQAEYLGAPEVHCTQAADGGVVCGGRSLR